jgi:ketosteroid isomerase-like protein
VSAEENTRLAQSAYEAFGRGDLAALTGVMADDIEWVSRGDPGDDPNAGTFNGKAAVLGWFGGIASTLDFTTFEPRESSPRTTRWCPSCTPRERFGAPARAFAYHAAHVWTFRDGKLARFQTHFDTAALAAAYRVQ